jgi:hypothetical protein
MIRTGQEDAAALLVDPVALERAQRIEAIDPPAGEEEGLADVVA